MSRNVDFTALLCVAFLAIWPNSGGVAFAQNQKLSVVFLDYPPYMYEENGKVVGLVVDVEKEAFEKAGYDVEFRIVPWSRALQEVKDGTSDVLASAGRTPDREQFLDYVDEPLYFSEMVLFVKKDRLLPYTGDLAELKEVVIGAVNNISYGAKFDDAVRAGRFQHLEYVNSTALNIGKLIAGRTDAMVAQRLVGVAELKKTNDLDKVKVLSPPIEVGLSFTAFSKAKPLGVARAEFEKQLKLMKEDGRYQKIYEKYSK
ncbi:polar amino acid transport system substrate-binding protein [Bradyrhizobium diazoefficiens]|uniref:substrate-binding periplasmic protein n=1 Tax=Bradyrhizobium diazoefficiens TaxID=1355477 RepID=UPI003519D2BB